MSKWILDIQSGTVVDAENCVIVDDFNTDFDEEEAFIDYAESVGIPVLSYRNPEEVHTVWCAEDVQELCMNLTDAEALEALQKVSKVLHELSISYGWEILETALASNGYEITMDADND